MLIQVKGNRLLGMGSLIAAALLETACIKMDPGNREEVLIEEQPIPTVEIVEAKYGFLPLHIQLTGQITARNQTDIYPEISGRIIEVRASNGDRVRKGDILVRLRDDELRERLKQAEHDKDVAKAQLRQAQVSVTRFQVQLRRVRELVEYGLESAIELEMLEADIAQAEASVDLAQAQLRRAEARIEEQKSALQNTVVKAPINGVLGNRNAEIGMRIDGGTRLFVIGDPSNMTVTVTLSEQWANKFRQGSRVKIHSPYLKKPIESSIRRLSPFLDPVSHTTIAEIEVPNPGGSLQPGMFVSVDVFHGEAEKSLILPKAALYENPGSRQLGVYAAGMDGTGGQSSAREKSRPADKRGQPVLASIEFFAVEIASEDSESVSIRNLDKRWIVINGQKQLAEWGSREAYVRPVEWDHVLRLQRMQARDLLEGIRDGTTSGQ